MSLDGGDACVRMENAAQAEQEDGRGMAHLGSSAPWVVKSGAVKGKVGCLSATVLRIKPLCREEGCF